MIIENFKYDEDDIVSDTIVNFCMNACGESIQPFIDKYMNDKKFFHFIQKNFLVNKISVSYLLRLYNDYEDDNVVDEYDYITSVNTTRWI